MYKGDLEGFPKEVVEKMLEYQFKQTGKKDVSVFENNSLAGKKQGGFNWLEAVEDHDWWWDVVIVKKFDRFFERYPKQSNQNTMSDLKQKLQEIIALVPEKEAELKELFPDAFKPEYFQFGDEFKISTACGTPVFIGQYIAPSELRYKCLVVRSDYRAEIIEYDGNQLITFKEKP